MDKAYDRLYLEKLAFKFKQGTITPEEQTYYDTWYNHYQGELLELSEQPELVRDRMLHHIQSHVARKKPVVVKHLWKYAAAACILVIGSVSAIIFFTHQKSSRPLALQERIKAGTNGAVLTLANGRKIILEQTKAGTITQQGSTFLQKANDSLLVYQSGQAKQSSEIAYNTLETPVGRQYQIVLPDGSKVWLNAASSLRYPTSFAGKERKVTLTGEGYFEVAKDKAHPFIVQSAGQNVKVLGTHFNINTYADEPVATTTLLEGSVLVSHNGQQKTLRPGQRSEVNRNDITVSEADGQLATAWKDGLLAFHKTKVSSILRQVARWYDIEIVYQGKTPDFTISGEVPRQADLSQMLKILKLSEVHYELNGRTLTITN